jgi:hypothetical protein
MHHLVNLGLTFLATSILFALIYTLSGSKGLAASLTALVLVHRSAVPAVYWITGRVESLLAVGLFGSLLSAVAYVRGTKLGLSFIAFLGSLLLALLSKESAVLLPVVLYVALPHARDDSELRRKRFLTRTATVVVITFAIFLYFQFYIGSNTFGVVNPGEMARGLARCGLLAVMPVSEWWLQSAPVLTLLLFGIAAGVVMLLVAGRKALVVWRTPAILFIGSLAPILIVQGGGGVRQLYVPLALACVGLALSLQNDPKSYRKVAIAAAALAIWSCLSSISASSEWVRNGEIAERCCRDYRRIVSTGGSEVILLTTPRSIGDAPVFSNDSRAALYHCRTGSFGYDAGVDPIAEMVTGHPAAAIPMPGSGFERRIPNATGWFVHPYIGQTASTRKSKLTILIPGEFSNQSQAFRFLPPEKGPDGVPLVLEFNGSGLSLALKSPNRK